MILLYKYVQKKRKEKQRLELLEAQKAARTTANKDTNHEDTGSQQHPELQTTAETDVEKANTTIPDDSTAVAVSEESPAEKKARRIHRWKVVFGLFAPFALQALDTTIIAAALPFIAQDFNQVKQLNWIISSFNLTSAAFLFLWAQLADIIGRFATLQSAIIIMVVGSAVCTGTPTDAFGLLLFGRSLQGIGVAGVGICIRTILADRVSLAEYAIVWTIFSQVAGVSFGIGPVIGGHLTQVSWRWCFAINLPIGVAALVLVTVLLRKSLVGPEALPEDATSSSRMARIKLRLSSIDYGGQFLFLASIGLLLLALTWGGGTYSWTSVNVLAPLLIGAVLFVAWVFYEYLMSSGGCLANIFPRATPMMPWNIMMKRDIGLLFIVNLTTGMAMFAVLYFMDVYFTLVQGKSASSAGNQLLYYIPGLAAGGWSAMMFSSIWPRQTFPVLMLGSTCSAVGMTVMAWAVRAERTSVLYGMMALVGFGVAIRLNPGSLHGLAYFPDDTARITCLAAFALPCGGLIGLTIMTTVFTNKNLDAGAHAHDSIMWAFISIIPFMWVGVIATALLGNVWILDDDGYEVTEETYLWALLRGRKITKQFRTRGENRTVSE